MKEILIKKSIENLKIEMNNRNFVLIVRKSCVSKENQYPSMTEIHIYKRRCRTLRGIFRDERK